MGNKIMYRHIYTELLGKIQSGEYRPGDKLATEKDISNKYQVSRITSKRALDMLAEEGYIERIPGRGSFVRGGMEQSSVSGNNTGVSGSNQKIIGVILDGFFSYFGCHLLKTIEQECSRRNYTMFLKCTYGRVEEENEAIQRALELGASGLILMCVQGESYNSTILRLSLDGFPMILVDRQMKGVPIPCVRTDNYTATKELTDILAERGHKNITFVTHEAVNTSTVSDRHMGFSDSIMQFGGVSGNIMQIDDFDITPDDSQKEYQRQDISGIKENIRRNEQNGYTAYLAAEYRLARLLGAAMDELGMERDIVTFDCIDPLGQYASDFIYVKQDEYQMGKNAVAALDRIIKGERFSENIDVPYEIHFH